MAQGRVCDCGEVGTGAEVAVVAGQDRDALAIVRLELLERRPEGGRHRTVDGIASFRAVQVDDRDRTVDLHANVCANRCLPF